MEENVKRGLSASWLKCFACVFMLIDHLGHVWNPFFDAAAHIMPLPLWGSVMYYLGRLAFPIFVFFVAEGCRKTHDIKRYLLRLGVFAVVAQVPFTLLFEKWAGSVILTFFLGVLGVYCYQKLREHVAAPVAALPAVAFAVLAELLGSDYGWLGVALVLALYLCGENRKRQFICLAVGLAALYLVQTPLQYLITYWIIPGSPFFGALIRVVPEYLKMYLLYHLIIFGSAMLALIPLYFYHGDRGSGNKYFFYIFYPAHLFILFIIARCIA